MRTNDKWRARRKLIGDTMSDSILEDVGGPQLCSTAFNIIDLWREEVSWHAGITSLCQ